MVYVTVKKPPSGNHGHRIKDILGAISLAELAGWRYVHAGDPMIDGFALGHGELSVSDVEVAKVVDVDRRAWSGMSLADTIGLIDNTRSKCQGDDILLSLSTGTRVHPFQLCEWFRDGKIQNDIFWDVVWGTRRKFDLLHPRKTSREHRPVNVAIHINRGADVKNPKHHLSAGLPRFMFAPSYFLNVIEGIRAAFRDKAVTFNVYVERLNSQDVVEAFNGAPSDIRLHIGPNRWQISNSQAVSIFEKFISADVLVACNSSFSVVAGYYRPAQPTIYHPHNHFRGLPLPPYFPTEEDGGFDWVKLREFMG